MNATDICLTPEDCRKAFKNTAKWKSVRAAVLADHSRPCHFCNQLIRYDLKKPHPLSPSVEHWLHKVEDQVGLQAWEAKQRLTAIEGLAPAHYGCNSRYKYLQPPNAPPPPEPEPLTPMEFRNTKTGDVETFLVNDRTILSSDWVAA